MQNMTKICFLLFLLCRASTAYAQQPSIYENLVFEGAGIRGIAYSGVLHELEKKEIIPQIKNVGGTSAGAITALMLSLGYTSEEVYAIIADTKFQKFNDGAFFFIGGYSRMRKRFGWYKSNKFEKWLQEIINRKTNNPDITFAELQNRGYKSLYLYVTGTCLNRQDVIVFSAKTYPNMKVKDAVRISMSIPLYFEAGFIDKEGNIYKKRKHRKAKEEKGEIDVVVDGGIIANFPIFIFDSLAVDLAGKKVRIPNMKTLGVRIDTDEQIKNDQTGKGLAHLPIRSIRDYVGAFYVLVLENLNRNELTKADWERTISVSSVGISPRIKRLSQEQKKSLQKSGETHTLQYLQKRR